MTFLSIWLEEVLARALKPLRYESFWRDPLLRIIVKLLNVKYKQVSFANINFVVDDLILRIDSCAGNCRRLYPKRFVKAVREIPQGVYTIIGEQAVGVHRLVFVRAT
jgi:hypothetical protein